MAHMSHCNNVSKRLLEEKKFTNFGEIFETKMSEKLKFSSFDVVFGFWEEKKVLKKKVDAYLP